MFTFKEMKGHDWQKVNTTSLKGGIDKYSCKNCGLKGIRSFCSDGLYFDKRLSVKKIYQCQSNKNSVAGKIRVIDCKAFNHSFSNIIPGTIHEIIEAPNGIKETLGGVWVMGVGEPVKLLNDEFELITEDV